MTGLILCSLGQVTTAAVSSSALVVSCPEVTIFSVVFLDCWLSHSYHLPFFSVLCALGVCGCICDAEVQFRAARLEVFPKREFCGFEMLYRSMKRSDRMWMSVAKNQIRRLLLWPPEKRQRCVLWHLGQWGNDVREAFWRREKQTQPQHSADFIFREEYVFCIWQHLVFIHLLD